MAEINAEPTAKPKLSKKAADDIVKEVRERLQQSWDADQDNRADAASDLRFLAGDQWPEATRRQYDAAGRPMLTINRLPQFLRQVTNPIREADLAIKVSPVDDQSDPKVAEIYNGLLKQIQYQSSADAVYASAAEHQAGCGIGWFRVTTQYVDDSVFDQELRLKWIPNPLSVYDDPAAHEPDRSDAMWRCVTEMIPLKSFKDKYPKAATEAVDVPTDMVEGGFFWATSDDIRVCEYWRKVPVKKMLGLLRTGETLDVTDLDKKTKQTLGVTRERECETFKIEQYLVSGTEVLEGPTEWAGKYIPICPIIGSEIPLEKGTYRYGVIRFARDAQQLYNLYRTASAEAIANTPRAPFLVTAEMIGDTKSQWDTHNRTNRPYLIYKPDPKAGATGGKPERVDPPAYPVALVNEAQAAEADMSGTTGIYPSTLGQRSNETSGVAIDSRKVQGDTANYHYGDNFARGLEYAGRVLIDMIPKIYDNERIVRILGDDGEEDYVPINKTVMGMDGIPQMMNDLSAARFDVRVTIGKSASTKRIETADSMFNFIKAIPEAAPLIGDLIAKNSDWPGAEQIAKRLRNMVPPQALVDPDDPNAPQPQGPPDPMSDPVIKSEVEKNNAQAELYHMQAFALAATTAQGDGAEQQPLAPYETEQAQADLMKTQADARATHASATKQEIENHMVTAAAQQGLHPMQTEGANAMLTADNQHLQNTLERGQAQRGQHEKQAAYADIARQLQEAKAAKAQGRVH